MYISFTFYIFDDFFISFQKKKNISSAIHPQGKIVEGPNLRLQLAELITATRQLYEDSCELLRERNQTLILREDLETKLSVALANTEMELRKCTVTKSADGQMRASLNVLAPNEEVKIIKFNHPFSFS